MNYDMIRRSSIVGTALVLLVVAGFSPAAGKDSDRDNPSVSVKKPKTTATQTTGRDSAVAVVQNLQNGEPTTVAPSPTAGEEINWSVIGAGGASGTSTNWIMTGTVGQTAVGSGVSTNYVGLHGFWQDFTVSGPGCCVGITGNVNGDSENRLTIGDVAMLIDAKFIDLSCDGLPCLTEADVNQSGGTEPDCADISIGDISLLIDYLFITGPSLVLPNCP